MKTLRILSYEEWVESEVCAAKRAEQAIDCPACDGIGEGIEECDLGHEHEVECSVCDGTGKLDDLSAVPEHQLQQYFTRRKYEEAVLWDVQALARWLVQDPAMLLMLAGFQPYMTVNINPRFRELRIGERNEVRSSQ